MHPAALLRRALFGALLLVAFCSPAFAQFGGGINLSWDDCGSFGSSSKTFACDTNSGQDVLFGSAIAPEDLPQFLGVEVDMTVVIDGPTVSDWWRLDTSGTTGCRRGAFTANSDFTAGPFHCGNPYGPAGTGIVDYSRPGNPNQARLRLIQVTQGQVPRFISGGQEYQYFKVVLTHAKATGTNSCAGCSAGATLYLMSLKLVQTLGVGDYFLTQPIDRNFVTWQGGSPVATRRSTWGSVKSLYR